MDAIAIAHNGRYTKNGQYVYDITVQIKHNGGILGEKKRVPKDDIYEVRNAIIEASPYEDANPYTLYL